MVAVLYLIWTLGTTSVLITLVRQRVWVLRRRSGWIRRSKIEADLVGPAKVEVVADQLFEERPTGQRTIQHLGQGELGLQDRQLVAQAGVDVCQGERARRRSPGSGQDRNFVGVQVQTVGSPRYKAQAVSSASSGSPARSPVGKAATSKPSLLAR